MSTKKKKTTEKPKARPPKAEPTVMVHDGLWKYWLPVLAITFVLFIPALSNGFTNWDDILYVTNNPLLKDLSIDGLKEIFSTPVVSNYHPLTILSLALNYQAAELQPMTYHLTSIILHVINTGLVFWFIWLLSSGNRWVSAAVALLFGIHPMHVESVAWISERKDLLYTMFYVAAMIAYVKYVRAKEIKHLVIVTVLGGISLLCKPAAIVLPLSLLAIDFYLRRPWNTKWIIEKIPLFVLSGVLAYATMAIQAKRAIASVELHSIVERINFAGFGFIWYLLKVVVPYPLSSLHPFPPELTPMYYLGTLASIALVVWLALKVRNRNILFGFGFYLINLLLVLQVISIGNAVVAERYTYVPYISIFFMLAMEIYALLQNKWSKIRPVVLGLVGTWIVAMALMSWQRIGVWHDSQTLWENVLSHYPKSPRAWTNKGLDLYDQGKYPAVVDDLTKALEADPNYADALEWRSRAYLQTQQKQEALADAKQFQKLYPQKETAQFALARAYEANKMSDEAIAIYNQLIAANPTKVEYINNRGVIYFNNLKNYTQAMADFEAAIRLSPENGSFYLNMSRCFYMTGDQSGALTFAKKAKELGTEIEPYYAQLVGIQ